MSYFLVNIITYGLGIVFWILFYRNNSFVKGILYGICSHIIASVALAFFVNVFLSSYTSSQLIFAGSALAAIWLNFIKGKHHKSINTGKGNLDLIYFVVLSMFILAFATNTIIQSREKLLLPIIGMNDDTATHLAMSAMTIKKESLLFKNSILDALIKKGIDYQNARYYPPAVYTYTALLYDTFSHSKDPLDLRLLLNIYAAFSFSIFLIFILSILDLAFDLVKSVNIWSLTPILVFILFFVGGEYFMILYRMSYLTQLLGNAFLLIAFGSLGYSVQKNQEGKNSNTMLQIKAGLFVMGIGLTYYLFLPVVFAGVMYWFLSNNNYVVEFFKNPKKVRLLLAAFKQSWIIILSLALSLVPLLLYSISHSVIDQITIPGINLLTFATLIQFCFMALLFIILKKYFVDTQYKVSLVGLLTSLALAIATTTPAMLKDGMFPYYFYKSFFTSSTFAVAFGVASIFLIVSHVNRYFHKFNSPYVFAAKTLLWVLLPLSFVYYLYAYKTQIPGYKGITYLSSGFFNYYTPHTTQKLIKLYEENHNKKIAVYNPGYWGENILLFALFENIPQIHIEGTRREIFYFSQNPNYYLDDIVKSYKSQKDVYIFDGHGAFKPRNIKR